jgi:hypothetical protein
VADKTPAEKMRCKPDTPVALLRVPDDLSAALGFPEGVAFTSDLDDAGFILAAATTQAEAEAALTELAPHVVEATVAWLAYPKGAKAAGRDLSRDTVWRFAPAVGLTLVANVSVDQTWSALRLRPERGSSRRG